MSKASAETALALFNRTEGRGDVFSQHYEDGAMLAALSEETIGKVMWPFYQWWQKGVDLPPKDEILRMIYERMKAHQLENAAKRGVSLKNWYENAVKGGRPKGTKKPSGNQEETKRVQLEDTSNKIEDASSKSSIDTCISVAGAGRGGLTPPARPALSVKEAKKVLTMDAPQISSRKELRTAKGDLTAWASRALSRSVDAVAVMAASDVHPDEISTEMYDGIDNESFYLDDYEIDETNNGEAFARQIVDVISDSPLPDAKRDHFVEVMRRALVSAVYDSRKAGVKNREAFIIARLKRASAAVQVLEAAKDRTSELPEY